MNSGSLYRERISAITVGNVRSLPRYVQNFVLVGSNNVEFYAVRLVSVQLAAKSGGVGILNDAPGCTESSFGINFPLLEVLNHVWRGDEC